MKRRMNARGLLEAFALDNAGWEEHMRAREARKRREAPVPQFIQVEGTNAHGAVDVARYLKSFEGKPLDPQKLDQVLTRLTGVGRYDSAGYRLTLKTDKRGCLSKWWKKLSHHALQAGFELDCAPWRQRDFFHHLDKQPRLSVF